MPEPQSDRDRPGPARPVAQRREVADWEYQTAYVPSFQVRIPEGLHARLGRWAERERKALDVLLIEILERAASTRPSLALTEVPQTITRRNDTAVPSSAEEDADQTGTKPDFKE